MEMKEFIKKLKSSFGIKPGPTVTNWSFLPPNASEAMFYRYRKHRGVNLGQEYFLETSLECCLIVRLLIRFLVCSGTMDH